MQPSSVMKGTSLPLGNIGEYVGMGVWGYGGMLPRKIAEK